MMINFDEQEEKAILAREIANRADAGIIADLWDTVQTHRHQLVDTMRTYGKTTGADALEGLSRVELAALKLWFSIHSLAQTYRPAFTAALLRELRHDFMHAVTAAGELAIDARRMGLEGNAIHKVMSHLRRAIQARADSMEYLGRAGMFAKFEEIGSLIAAEGRESEARQANP